MVIKMYDFGGRMPVRAHEYDAGADVFPMESFSIAPGETKKIPLGIGLEVPVGMTACIFPRSSLGSKGITTHLAPIDTGYTGEIHAIVTNTSKCEYHIGKNVAIGQLVMFPVVLSYYTFDDIINNRGNGAFGSTGHADVEQR